jgi:hypothetical protein
MNTHPFSMKQRSIGSQAAKRSLLERGLGLDKHSWNY